MFSSLFFTLFNSLVVVDRVANFLVIEFIRFGGRHRHDDEHHKAEYG